MMVQPAENMDQLTTRNALFTKAGFLLRGICLYEMHALFGYAYFFTHEPDDWCSLSHAKTNTMNR